jgi:ribosomal-protein-alanine N-acetyltransferase
MPLYIRKMAVSDLEQVMEIEVYSFPTPWPRHIYEHDLTQNVTSRFFVALDGGPEGDVAGYIGNWFVADECHIGSIATKREARGRGVAEALIIFTARAGIVERISYIVLEVRVNNFAAINLYKKLGFKQVGIRRGYYRDTGEDALIMAMHDLPGLAAREAQIIIPGKGDANAPAR